MELQQLHSPQNHEILSYSIASCFPTISFDEENRPNVRVTEIRSALRFWWRVVKIKNLNYDYKELLEQELKLFGSVGSENKTQKTSKSKITIFLTFQHGRKVEPITFDENNSNTDAIGYLTYGVKDMLGQGSKKAAYYKDKAVTINITTDKENIEDIQLAMQLLSTFGGIGSKSRNGFGSFYNEENFLEDIKKSVSFASTHTQDFSHCINNFDWPASFANDKKGLLAWKSVTSYNSWKKDPISVVYQQKKAINKLTTGDSPMQKDRKGRIPSQIRFRFTRMEDNQFHIICYHLPYFTNKGKIKTDIDFWTKIYSLLDEDRDWIRLTEKTIN